MRQFQPLRCLKTVQLWNNIQRWLSPSNVQDDLYRYQLEYMPGSCDWILETPQAQTCFSPPSQTSMLIQGRPGTGKTVLTSFLVNHFTEQNWSCVRYFFCKVGDFEKREANRVHRTLLAQLLHHEQIHYTDVEPLYMRNGRATIDSFVDISSAILLAFSKSSQTAITVIVDALDECENI